MFRICAGMVLLFALFSLAVVTAQSTTAQDVDEVVRYRLERVTYANFPVGMAFAPDGRLFFNEKTTGNVRVVTPDGVLQPEPVITLATDALVERGMLGIALDPHFAENNRMYIFHTTVGTARDFPANRLVRFTVGTNNRASAVEELIRFPITTGQLIHNAGNIQFDDEGYLYLTLGDYGVPAKAQDTNTPQGGIHRFALTEEGIAPAPGNPFGDENSLLVYGMRNPFDLAVDPFSNKIFATESGPTCDDEVNVLLPGFNYGWGDNYECSGTRVIPGLSLYAPPMLSYTPPIAPTGIVVYDGDMFPQWRGDLFFCAWNTGILRRIVLDESRTRAVRTEDIDLGNTQCRIDLAVAPDGSLYFGTVGGSQGAIIRLVARSL